MANEQNQATMQLPMDLIAPAIQAHVNAAVIEALKGSDMLIILVTEIMGHLVDSDGKANSYGAKTPWLTWAVHNIVREAVKGSIKEHLAKKEDVIRKQIDAEFRKSNSKIVRSLVENMGAAMADKFADSYRLNITFSTP
jgi:hypothetical protein